MTAAKENKALVLRMYSAFDAGELSPFQVSISPEFTARVMGNMTMDWKGFMEFGSSFLSAFPDGHHVFDHVVVEGDCIATIGRYLGTHEGELMGIAPTHRPVDLTVMHLDRIKDGRIVEHRGLANAMDLLNQLGASAGN